MRTKSRVDDLLSEGRRRRRNQPDLYPVLAVVMLFALLLGVAFAAMKWETVVDFFDRHALFVVAFLIAYAVSAIVVTLKAIERKL